MDAKTAYLNFLQFLPGIEGPSKRQNFRQKLIWTAIVLVAFFVMSEITVWGAGTGGGQFARLQVILGSTIGSLMTLGIGPIVTASIILQLLNGSGLINIDTNSPEGREIFQGSQKLLAVLFSIFEAVAFVLFGAVPPASGNALIVLAVITQLAFGGIIVILMDEVISKWGIGSGISLFIAAGVSRQIFIQAFNFVESGGTIRAVGVIPSGLSQFIAGQPGQAFITLLPIVFTLVVFFGVVYTQAIKVEIPLALGSGRGYSTKYPLKFFYTSNIPVILVSALFANFQMMTSMLQSRGITILGTLGPQGTAQSGFISWVSPPSQAALPDILISMMSAGVSMPAGAWRWIPYTLFFIVGSTIFSIFWVQTSGQDPESVAEQIHQMGMGVPGFRSDPRMIRKVLDRYVNALAVLGGAAVGALAAFADFTGALGTGTGILLTVMIIYQFYEQIVQEHMEDMHPMLRKFMES